MFKGYLFASTLNCDRILVFDIISCPLSSQSSDRTKSLKLPVDYSVLKAIVDYIYTDEAPDGLGECTLQILFLTHFPLQIQCSQLVS